MEEDSLLKDTSTQHQTQQQEVGTLEKTSIQRREPLKAFVVTSGSRGDLQPYVAFAQKLSAMGHAVGFVTNEVYKDFVLKYVPGIEFFGTKGTHFTSFLF